ncbi:MAG: DUF998 domain-containing protein [Gemmatimonadaceae bacterium]|nr:DUF998 domain-containing protein [Gemmatimonadaceae bacterium]
MNAPVARTLLTRLSFGLAAGVISFALTTVQGVLRDGYDSWHQAISALALGPGGWLQMLNLTVFGAVLLTTVSPWRRILSGGIGAVAYPALTALVGVSFMVLGLVRQDPAPGYDPEGLAHTVPTAAGLVHLAIAGVAAFSSVASLFVMASRFAANANTDTAWPRWALYSRATALVVVVCVVVYGVWSVESSGYAGTFERMAMLAPMVWMFALLRRLYRGVPIM